MKISEIRSAGVRHGMPQGGWSNEIQPEDGIHTLIAVFTDKGINGWGSAFTNDELVQAALYVLKPYAGENPLEPERVSEKLPAHTFWLGGGGSIRHTISGIDIAIWDILGKATNQPVGRLLGGRYRDLVPPYASLLMREGHEMAEHLAEVRPRGFRAFKIGWGPFGRQRHSQDLVEIPWKLDSEGMLPVPSSAGLGVSIDMDAVDKYTGRRFASAGGSV